ncbi:ankyrin repeat and SAM domain-containing protein 3-like [Penaeus monodon]|uniref:ankyrin repeat and SAM domain-containing protein 3-like n=1 Tax=Penaeus monodon TaxID=6687 RepID=UPI0018A6DEE2|nr:ankyrin repeat and SAM domain-containing protein 3-like [Penaeus monodon]XP_037777806.1 ankyrin repeat and SAM domain-containing protein 3-like [Penaeus monodon]
MAELEETWTERNFYDRPLSVWLQEDCGEEDFLLLDIFTAASIGCCQRVGDIIKKDEKAVGYKNKGGWTALMYAAYYDHSDVVKLLLEANASVHLTNNARCNALMLAVMCGNESIVETLIKAGSILEARDNWDWTALFHAVNSGHHSVVDTLLRYRANPNSCERRTGMTPLMYGAQHGNSSIVTTLLKGGALVSLTTHQGHTAARIAQDADYHAIAAIITQWGLQGENGPSLPDGPAAVEARLSQHAQLQPRCRGNAVPSVDSARVIPTDLETLLNQLSLGPYMSVFKEQDVDLQMFLTLTDQELKECGIHKLGPRRKMTSAIARWHSNAPLWNSLECAYADKLEVEMQELGVKLTEAMETIQQTKAQVYQEHNLRVVTEGWIVEARGRLHDCHQRCQMLLEQMSVMRHCTSVLSAQFSLIQPTLISPLVESISVATAHIDALLKLTDPSVARGPSNPSSPRRNGHQGSYPNTPR